MSSISFNTITNPYYLGQQYSTNNYFPYYQGESGYYGGVSGDNYQDKDEKTTKTLGLAALLQAIALGIQKGSNLLSARLAAGREFATPSDVNRVASQMVRENNLDVHIGYIDEFNKHQYANRYGMAKEFDTIARGQNAFYADKLKIAVAPKSKPSLILHELGHAINAKGRFTKMLQNSRRFAGYAPMTLLLANSLFKKSDNQPTFIERNAGVLGFCAFLPTIIEEGLASFRGIKAAKKVLNNTAKLNILKKNYAVALGTYILAGLGLGVACKQSIVESRL